MATWTEALRRLYREMVKRRSTVRITPAAPRQLQHPPVFLIGAFRSGTTLVRYIVDSHSRLCCPPETNFIRCLQPVVEDEYARGGLGPMGFDTEHVRQKMRDLCIYFFENYAAAKGKVRWADKTPDYVDCLPFLYSLFPEAQFVMIYRHGLDQANSMTRGGSTTRPAIAPYDRDGSDVRVAAVRYWRAQVEKMFAFERAHPEQCHRIFYEDLCEAPETHAKKLFNFLGEAWEPDVLRFYEQQHDTGHEDGRAAATRGFSVSRHHYVDWEAEVFQQCMKIAAPTLDALGYKTAPHAAKAELSAVAD